MKHIKDKVDKILSRSKRNRVENRYYNLKDFLSKVLTELRDTGIELGFAGSDIVDDIKDEVLEVTGEYID